jgi:hypothetical protein
MALQGASRKKCAGLNHRAEMNHRADSTTCPEIAGILGKIARKSTLISN